MGEQEDTDAPWESFAVDQLGLSRDERFAYAKAVERQEDALIHRLLGHPDPVQGDMQLDVNWPATASTAATEAATAIHACQRFDLARLTGDCCYRSTPTTLPA